MPERVRLTDVSPRDGLQNEAGLISSSDKIRLICALCQAGVDEVEVTSFVSAKWVPQLGDSAEVCGGLAEWIKLGDTHAVGGSSRARPKPSRLPVFTALVPNERGMDGFEAANSAAGHGLLSKVAVFMAASETFSQRNTNASIAEVLARFKPVIARARQSTPGASRVRVRGYVSCVIACPFEGAIAPDTVRSVVGKLVALGVDEIDLGDTVGAGTPESVAAMLSAVRSEIGAEWWTSERLTLHLHDTFGNAGACVRAALDLGVRSFDGSVAGLGGCPYASTPGRRAPGNIASELVVKVAREAGFEVGVDDDALRRACDLARELIGPSYAKSDSLRESPPCTNEGRA